MRYLSLFLVILVNCTGCLTQLTQNLAPSGEFVNYALAENGATAVASIVGKVNLPSASLVTIIFPA